MSIKATAAPGAIIALPRNKAHVVKEISPAGNYGALCGKVVPPAALEQADDSNICGNCKRLNAAVEPEHTPDETPVPTEHAAPVAPRPEPVKTYAGAWFVESFTPGRFGGWMTEAGGFDTEREARTWLADNRDKLMNPNHETRVIREGMPGPVNATMPILADKLVLPDTDELARATDPDNNDPRDRLGVLELGKDRIRSGRRRKVSDREKKRDHKPLPEKQARITPIGSRLNDPGNHVGGPGTTSPDPVVARIDGVAMLPIGETGMAGVRPDPKIKYMDIVGGRYGYLTRTEYRAHVAGMTRSQRETFRRAYRRTVKANRESGHVPAMGSRRVVPIERVRGAK